MDGLWGGVVEVRRGLRLLGAMLMVHSVSKDQEEGTFFFVISLLIGKKCVELIGDEII